MKRHVVDDRVFPREEFVRIATGLMEDAYAGMNFGLAEAMSKMITWANAHPEDTVFGFENREDGGLTPVAHHGIVVDRGPDSVSQ